MTFAICPDGAAPRVFRFCDLETPSLISILDTKKNVLWIDRTRFDALSPLAQQLVLTTKQHTLAPDDLPVGVNLAPLTPEHDAAE